MIRANGESPTAPKTTTPASWLQRSPMPAEEDAYATVPSEGCRSTATYPQASGTTSTSAIQASRTARGVSRTGATGAVGRLASWLMTYRSSALSRSVSWEQSPIPRVLLSLPATLVMHPGPVDRGGTWMRRHRRQLGLAGVCALVAAVVVYAVLSSPAGEKGAVLVAILAVAVPAATWAADRRSKHAAAAQVAPVPATVATVSSLVPPASDQPRLVVDEDG